MRLLSSIALSAALISTLSHAAPRVLEPGDLFHMQWAADPQIRKDGSQIAYTRIANDIMTDNQVSSLWLLDTATGAQTPLANGSGSHSSARWSPDGTRIAYLSTGADGKTQIMMHWMRGETASLTRLTEAPIDITWSPDGKQLAFIMLEPTAAPTLGKQVMKPPGAQWGGEPVVVDSMNFRADGQGAIKPGYQHVYVMSVDGGGVPRQLTSGPYSDAGPLAWSPDGKALFFAGNRTEEWRREPQDWARHTAMTLSVYRLTLADGNLQQLTRGIGPYRAPAISPDGKLVAFLGYEDKHVGNQNVRLHVMNADGSNTRVIGESLDRSLTDCQWDADGRGLYVEYADHGITKVARMGLDGRVTPAASDLGFVMGTTQLPYSGGQRSPAGGVRVPGRQGEASDGLELAAVDGGKHRQAAAAPGQGLHGRARH
jgi:Tol biopolymer transport system component